MPHTKKSLLFALLASAGALSAQTYVYVDATSGVSGNTTLANGSTFTPPLNGTTGIDNNWEQRTTFGSNGNIFEAGGENANENAPEIRTRISGLVPGGQYSVLVLFWDPTSAVEDWNVRAGFTSNAGANTVFAANDAATDLAAFTPSGSVLASTLVYSTTPTIFAESGRALLAATVGSAFANINGEIFVFIDDLPAITTVNRRTWYDGVAYTAIPEPSTYALFAGIAGLVAMVLRRRRS